MNIYEKLIELQKRKIPAMLVTVVSKKGEGPVDIGKKMLYTDQGIYGTVGGGALEYEAIERCKSLIKEAASVKVKYTLNEGKLLEDAETLNMVCGGVVELFYDYVGSKGYVTIFGGGHVGKALSHLLRTMAFHVTIVEDREDVYDSIEDVDVKIKSSYSDYIDEYGIKDYEFVIVCTPSHKYDYNVMFKIIELNMSPKYIGMLCSLGKLKDFMKCLDESYPNGYKLDNFYSPIGLDIGGNMPEEIAISIAAEMLSVIHGKSGHNHMRKGM